MGSVSPLKSGCLPSKMAATKEEAREAISDKEPAKRNGRPEPLQRAASAEHQHIIMTQARKFYDL